MLLIKTTPLSYSTPRQQTTPKNPPTYKPNIYKPKSTPKPQQIPKSEKPKIVCHKCGHTNHFAKDCIADILQKPKVKDSTYNA